MATKAQRGLSEPADLEAVDRDSVAVMRVTTVSEAVPAMVEPSEAGAVERDDASQATPRERPLAANMATTVAANFTTSMTATMVGSEPLPGVREHESEREITARDAESRSPEGEEITERSQSQQRELSPPETRSTTAFVANVGDIPMADLLRTIASGGKTGIVTVRHPGGCSRLWLANGDVIDAETGPLRGVVAVYRMLAITEGELVADFMAIHRERTITMSLQGLLMEAAFREDQCAGLYEQLGAAGHECFKDNAAAPPADLSETERLVFSLLDSERSIVGVVAASAAGDLETLTALQALRERGLLRIGVALPDDSVEPEAVESEIRQIRPAAEQRPTERSDISMAFDVLEVPDIRQVLEASRQRQRRILVAVGVLLLVIAAAVAYTFVGLANRQAGVSGQMVAIARSVQLLARPLA